MDGLAITPMDASDLDAVMAIEAASQPSPWPRSVFEGELAREWARLDVLRRGDLVLGFVNYWLVRDEVHLLNIAIQPDERRRGHGARLLSHLLEVARQGQARVVTLEVRRSNEAAQALYTASGFHAVGIRPKYYADNQEDAIVMLLEFASLP